MLCEPEQEFHLSLKSGMSSSWNSTLQNYLKQVLSPQIYVIETKLNFASFNNKNLQRQRKIVGECDFPIQNSNYADQVGSMLVQGLEIVTSLVQSAITCTQEWNVVQYLVNKTNTDSFHNESLSGIMKIAPYTVTHLFDPFRQIHIALPSEIK